MINRNNNSDINANDNMVGGMSLISYIRRMFENNLNSHEDSSLLYRDSTNYNRLLRIFENSENRNIEEGDWDRVENFVNNREEDNEDVINDSQENIEDIENEEEENLGIINLISSIFKRRIKRKYRR
jgi:hypothetical protein